MSNAGEDRNDTFLRADILPDHETKLVGQTREKCKFPSRVFGPFRACHGCYTVLHGGLRAVRKCCVLQKSQTVYDGTERREKHRKQTDALSRILCTSSEG